MRALRTNGCLSVSAPGVLHMLGNISVIYPKNPGIVLATKPSIVTSLKPGTSKNQIDVMCRDMQTLYHFDTKTMELGRFKNSYIQSALKTSLETVKFLRPEVDLAKFSAWLDVTGHQSFYNREITGIGSSSALVTSMVGCILHSFDITDLATIHLISQVAHCLAQKKVNLRQFLVGFDVACSVLGSQRYFNFDREILTPLLNTSPLTSISSVLDQLDWTARVPYNLPSKYRVGLYRVNLPMTDSKISYSKAVNWVLASTEDCKV